MAAQFPFSLAELKEQTDQSLIDSSFVVHENAAYWLTGVGASKQLAVLAPHASPAISAFAGKQSSFRDGYTLSYAELNHAHARALRSLLPWLTPKPWGLRTTAGFGDRLGLATPGHARALQSVLAKAAGRPITPFFAQQSIREMERTARSPEDVMTDATWGTFLAGWREGVGADADHLKTPADIDACVAAGFSFYTIDPGAYVDSAVDTAPAAEVAAKVADLPWEALEISQKELEERYVGQSYKLSSGEIVLEGDAVMRAAAKYGKAIAHVAKMYRHLASKNVPFELEVSVDETDTPTTHAEHIFIVQELRRLGVVWVSLAPRYVGSFEKGVDYIGDIDALRRDLTVHAAIARELGPYKLSLHSGSDKFSVYPIISELTEGVVHLKTAGTSYLEALRVIANVDSKLFREILDFDRARYETDRASYHVSAKVELVPSVSQLSDDQLPGLLEDFHARQVLHVTFGSTLHQYGDTIKALLQAHEEAYAATLERHFIRHIEPFSQRGA